LLPTLTNLYGLDVRFKYAERKIKEDKEKRKIKSKKIMEAVGGTERNEDSPPPNRHGRLIPKGAFVSPISYKIKGRNLPNVYNTI